MELETATIGKFRNLKKNIKYVVYVVVLFFVLASVLQLLVFQNFNPTELAAFSALCVILLFSIKKD